MSEHEVQPPAGEWPTRRPGHELCAARERVGISREDIARTLHLPGEQVDALEADDYVRLPPPAYVRGYLRAYAREVGMDPDQVVADYDAVCGEAEDPELVVQYGQADVSAGRGPVLALLVVIAVALVGAVAWWLQQPALSPIVAQEGATTGAAEPAMEAAEPATVVEPEEPATAAEPEEPAATQPAEPALPEAPETGEPAAGAGTGGEASAEAGAGGEATTASADGATGAGVDADDAGATGAGATGTGTETAEAGATEAMEAPAEEEVPESMVAEESELPTATSEPELVATEAAGVGPDRLVVDVDGESWLEVFDSRGRQLAYTLYSGDEPVELNGWAPFDIFLGNSPDVTLSFQGREIDHSAFVRSDNTARFLVDSEGARRR